MEITYVLALKILFFPCFLMQVQNRIMFATYVFKMNSSSINTILEILTIIIKNYTLLLLFLSL